MKQVPYRRSSAHISSKPFVRLEQFAFDEKVASVENTCKLLIESRFGPGFSYSFLDRPTGQPADEPVSFLDLIEEEFVPWYAMEYLGRTSGSVLRRQKLGRVLPGQNPGTPPSDKRLGQDLTISTRSPANLGRGSPAHRRTPYYLASPFANLAAFRETVFRHKARQETQRRT